MKIKVLIKEPNKEPYIKEVEDELKEYQKIVGGYLEHATLPTDNSIDIFMDEEGMLSYKKGNFWIPEMYDCIKGTCFFVQTDYENDTFKSLTEEQIKTVCDYVKYYEISNDYDIYDKNDYRFLNNLMRNKYNELNENMEID